jgi:SAM-dependent methyltransferase
MDANNGAMSALAPAGTASAAITPERILNFGLGFCGPKALLSAVEMGLFTELARGPLDAATLASRLSIHERGARDFFDLLVALGLLERENGRYSNTPEADVFLDRAKPGYVGGLLEMANTRLYPLWISLSEALRTGKPQNEAAHSSDTFAELYDDPARLRQFLGAMTGLSLPAAKAMAAQFPWGECKTFADIGCAQGALPVEVALAQNHVTSIGFDLPQVEPIFSEYAGRFGLNGRVRFAPGNFLEDELPKADVLAMGHILHDWDLETKRMLIAKAHRALPKGGALIVYECMIDDERRERVSGLTMSLNMLLETPGGFDFTGADCSAWMREAGFQHTTVAHLAGPEHMVVGLK